ncbi:hypothetical protein Tco_0423012, partial [Tanacetum coccineum]
SSPPLTGNYMPPLADLSFAGLDDSVYRPLVNKTCASVPKDTASVSQTSKISEKMHKVDSTRFNKVIIEDWVSDDEDVLELKDSQTTCKLWYANNPVVFVKSGENTRYEPVKTDKQAKKPKVFTQSPKVDRKDWNGKMTQKLGIGITKKT